MLLVMEVFLLQTISLFMKKQKNLEVHMECKKAEITLEVLAMYLEMDEFHKLAF